MPPSGRPGREVSCPAPHDVGAPESSTGGLEPRSRCSSGAGSRDSLRGRDMPSPRRPLVNSCHGRPVSTAGSGVHSCVGLAPLLGFMRLCIHAALHHGRPSWCRGPDGIGSPHAAGVSPAVTSKRMPRRTKGALHRQASFQPWNRCDGVAHARPQHRALSGLTRALIPDLGRGDAGNGREGLFGPGALPRLAGARMC